MGVTEKDCVECGDPLTLEEVVAYSNPLDRDGNAISGRYDVQPKVLCLNC